MISAFLPHTAEELLQIPGVGEGKASQYGADWLSITSGVQREHQYPLGWVSDSIDEESFVSWLYKQKELKYKKQLERLRLRRVLLQGLKKGREWSSLRGSAGSPAVKFLKL